MSPLDHDVKISQITYEMCIWSLIVNRLCWRLHSAHHLGVVNIGANLFQNLSIGKRDIDMTQYIVHKNCDLLNVTVTLNKPFWMLIVMVSMWCTLMLKSLKWFKRYETDMTYCVYMSRCDHKMGPKSLNMFNRYVVDTELWQTDRPINWCGDHLYIPLKLHLGESINTTISLIMLTTRWAH